MILILSYDWFEQGTDPVIDWLLYYKAPFIKISIKDLVSNHKKCYLDVISGTLWVDGCNITDKINVIWYRRFEYNLKIKSKNHNHLVEQAEYELNCEIESLIKHLYTCFRHKKWLTPPQTIDANKLDILFNASKRGIKVPKTIVCNNKESLIKFQSECKDGIIMKPIADGNYFVKGKYTYSKFTTLLTKSMIEQFPSHFVPTLFQAAIIAQYEIRVFYIEGRFFATAIILPEKRPDIDVKKSFGTSSIGWVPYKLPSDYEERLNAFFQDQQINTGSFDCILSREDEYIFIEINLGGQYSAPSHRCNYKVEKIIADWLINNDIKQ